jgi:hypothetical protein
VARRGFEQFEAALRAHGTAAVPMFSRHSKTSERPICNSQKASPPITLPCSRPASLWSPARNLALPQRVTRSLDKQRPPAYVNVLNIHERGQHAIGCKT